jgi:hypothetical protein
MKASGWVQMHRKAFDPNHALAPTKREPASKLHAWMDICQMAAHSPAAGLKRGELRVSLGFLVKRWKWHESRVRRFLRRLQSDTAIDTVTDTPQGTIYRVVNYDTYNAKEKPKDTPTDTHTDTNTKRTTKKTTPPLPPRSVDFEEFRTAYPSRHGGQGWPQAQVRFIELVKSGQTSADLILKAKEYATYVQQTGDVGTKITMMASSFLGPERQGYADDWSRPSRNGTGPTISKVRPV